MKNGFLLLAAKSYGEKWLPFYMHSRDTAEMMTLLFDLWLPEAAKAGIISTRSEDELRKLCRLLGYIHDIGKITAHFQKKIGKSIPGHLERLEDDGLLTNSNISVSSFSHAWAGQAILCEMGIKNGVEIIVGSHHGKPAAASFHDEKDFENNGKAYYADHDRKSFWEALWKDWIEYALAESGYQEISELPVIDMEGQMILSGLLIMADWIASNTEYFPLIDLDEGCPEDYQARIDNGWESAWNGIDPEPWQAGYDFIDDDVFEEKFGFLPNTVQKSVINAVSDSNNPGIYILEAQMGVGKTEAALAAAEVLAGRKGCGGLFFGLPTQATSNGIFNRLCSWAEKQGEETGALYSVKLAHGNAELNEYYQEMFRGTSHVDDEYDDVQSGVYAHEWFEGNKKSLLANFVIGTVDQLLMASLKRKHVMLRHLGLAGKVSIIDECHAYDAYMNQYLDRTLNWLGAYGVPVIILSATLPAKRRAALVDAYLNRNAQSDDEAWRDCREYPLLTWTDGSSVKQEAIPCDKTERKVNILKSVRDDTEEVAQFLAEKLSEGGCAGIIVNSVAKSQQFAEELRMRLDESYTIDLFHSRFIMTDRSKKESELIENVGKSSSEANRYKRIVIGTQVLEQSLDLDFDLMITELCPMDLLLQRIGRLHRHKRLRPEKLSQAECAVLQTESRDEASTYIYGDWLLMRTEGLLSDEIILPGDIAGLVQETYGEPTEELDTVHNEAYRQYLKRINDKRMKGKAFCLGDVTRKKKQTHLRRRRNTEIIKKTMKGLLDTAVDDNLKADAAVRDGDDSIEVIVMVCGEYGGIYFLPWQHSGVEISIDEIPTGETERIIAAQKLRLPSALCRRWNIDATIKELTEMTQTVAILQSAHLLRGELFLLLNQNLSAKISGYTIQYDKELGLQYWREGDEKCE